ncbi:lipase/esterase, putative [Acanthamoeba castellanii str. Neff]|uniref:Lipase/esterase, putative n=1 Tax=Acanthamoeba castellanii (strain ATCC 30010 / Neff) TaxID=1257118 RepID=L8HI58_ACACF|nr:lipase/esterase, putative [Acanthamoeba castellanii str. Neff]ELR24071.1 lipase/esterase, putative [Acanthamoeba castellanii str. Neff]
MKKALLVPLVVVALAVGLTAFHANFISQDRVDWRIKYLMDPAVRLVFRAAGMDKDEGRFDRAAFQRFMLSHEPTTGGEFVDGVRSEDLLVPPHEYPPNPHPLLADVASPAPAAVSVRVFEPKLEKNESLPVMIYIHGGGFTLGTGKDWAMNHVATRFAREGKMVVVSVDYRLAPEHPFPAAIEDCYSVLQWVARHGDGHPALAKADLEDHHRSAGGNLAAVLSLMAVERNAPVRVAYQLLIYPTCMAPPTPSAIEFADAYILPKWSSKFFKSQYLLGHDHAITAHHYLNPTKASFLDQSPHTHIVVAELDPLRDEGKDLGEQLKAAGVDCEVTQYNDTVHGFVGFWFLPESEAFFVHAIPRMLHHLHREA